MDQSQKQLFSIKINGPEDDEIFDYWLGGSDFTKCKHNQTMAHAILNLKNIDFSAIFHIKNDLVGLHLIYKAVKHSDVKNPPTYLNSKKLLKSIITKISYGMETFLLHSK